MRPTLAMVGDSRGGGSGREGILPLDDPAAMDAIAGALASRMGGRGNTYNHIEGVISSDVLQKVMRQMSAEVEQNNVPHAASHARRVVRK